MVSFRNQHNVIAGNTLAAVAGRLRGKPCRPFNSNTKIRIHMPRQGLSDLIRFYYPDASVVCRPNPLTDSFQDEPAVIFEVPSQRTRRIDEGEKKDAYLTIPSLSVYALIEQESAAVVVFRRVQDGFAREVHEGFDTVIPLPEIGIDLALAEIYESVEFVAEPEEN
jgi:Uma2 family endonuclease